MIQLSPFFKNEVDFPRPDVSTLRTTMTERIQFRLRDLTGKEGYVVREAKYHTHNRHFYTVGYQNHYMVASFSGANSVAGSNKAKALAIYDELMVYKMLGQDLPFIRN